MQKIIQYALSPPCSGTPATHYATVCGDVMQYLLIGADWFVKTFGWQYIQHVPHCTPVGQKEIPREQVATPKAPVVYATPKETPIYGNERWKGD